MYDVLYRLSHGRSSKAKQLIVCKARELRKFFDI